MRCGSAMGARAASLRAGGRGWGGLWGGERGSNWMPISVRDFLSRLAAPPALAGVPQGVVRPALAPALSSFAVPSRANTGTPPPPPAVAWASAAQQRWYSAGAGSASPSPTARQLAVWGNGDFGRLGLGAAGSVDVPAVCGALARTGVRQVACGGAHTVVLAEGGRVFCMGLNDYGQLAAPPGTKYAEVPLEVTLPLGVKATAVAAGHYHSACISEEGDVYTWGRNGKGQLGHGSAAAATSAEARQVASLEGAGIVAVALGAEHSLAVTAGGELFAWGCGASGRLGGGPAPLFQRLFGHVNESVPRHSPGLRGVKVRAVAAGHFHTACIDDGGALYTFGYGRFCQLGHGDERDQLEPKRVEELPPVAGVACGASHSVAVTVNGDVYAWGANESGCLGLGREGPSSSSVPLPVGGKLRAVSAVQVACGWKHTAALTANGQIYTWGWGGSQGSHAMDGRSSGGQLGLGSEFDSLEPALVPVDGCARSGASGEARWQAATCLQVSCGFNHTAAVLQMR